MIIDIGKTLKKKLYGEKPVFGPWVGIADQAVLEILARLAFDFLLVDAEHSAIDAKGLSALLPATDLYRMPVIFRPTTMAVGEMKTALDSGVAGLMIPMVETAEQAREIVSICKYAPLGSRGVGPWRASGFYDGFDDYLREANAATALIVQIESAKGLANAEEIAAVEGVDMLFVGPADLSSSLGLPIGGMSDRLVEAFSRVVRAAKAHGKRASIDLTSVDRLPVLRKLGFSLFTCGSDMEFIKQSGQRLLMDLSAASGG